MTYRILFLIGTLGVLSFCAPSVWGGPGGLPGGATLDELLNLEPAPKKSQAPQKDVREDLVKALTARQVGDAFEKLIGQMRDASERLGADRDSGLQTQRLQQEILDKLDSVIASAKRQSSSSKSGGSSSGGGKPSSASEATKHNSAQESDSKNGQAQAAAKRAAAKSSSSPTDQANAATAQQPGRKTGPIKTHRMEWGHLPQRLRDELMQGTRERFSPLYERLTEQYYQRLAEEADQ